MPTNFAMPTFLQEQDHLIRCILLALFKYSSRKQIANLKCLFPHWDYPHLLTKVDRTLRSSIKLISSSTTNDTNVPVTFICFMRSMVINVWMHMDKLIAYPLLPWLGP